LEFPFGTRKVKVFIYLPLAEPPIGATMTIRRMIEEMKNSHTDAPSGFERETIVAEAIITILWRPSIEGLAARVIFVRMKMV